MTGLPRLQLLGLKTQVCAEIFAVINDYRFTLEF